ncbi:protein kinase/lanthionine synthetase C family protein [Streptacidiphilus sp. PB12-B1b]|uniref:class III lanthionine synthetase LanKC n=1 Tax=Streptacidiphilus sp. PB12-B1b TaxID=2705012 RepID=UPI0015F8FAF1|nr:class III lanthionine synthetase LanKC [Streptacidiphilus sp. PB12-B1b]QMU78066.1 protein kinase/lanthionine synthetase C family protein [Streptacidiphilus sp. PB12-B1b]
MSLPIPYIIADREFYAPLECSRERGEEYRPSQVPQGWLETESAIWTMWYHQGVLRGVEDGWKVHVSARPGRQAAVLDLVADVCFAQDVAFKHLSSHLFYFWTHHKHASRAQGGKFIAAYPTGVDAARTLMESLRETLADEEGPYILSDRRYRDSRTVHYRYGGFTPRSRLTADGTRTLLVRDGDGREVEDRRGVAFHLPAGVADPFTTVAKAAPTPAAAPAPKAADPAPKAAAPAPITVHGFVFEQAVQYSNAGGAYLAHEAATGRPVFIKEARAHTGLSAGDVTAIEQLRREWEILRALHAAAPGLAPEPVGYFHQWEHAFMVTERIGGAPLNRWMVLNQPMLGVDRRPEEFTEYHARCRRILSQVEQALERLHALGYLFVDVSPGNVLVTDDDQVRLIDFEGVHRLGTDFAFIGTPGYTPPTALVGDDLAIYDDYGLSALALLLLGPFHQVVIRNPDALAHLRHDLHERAPVPEPLWQLATRYHRPGTPGRDPQGAPLPGPEQVAAEPERHLADLRDAIADGLLAMAEPEHPARVFPTIAEGYQSNTLCVAYGTAGVAHALHRAGRELPDGVLDRLRREAVDSADDLGPGLYVGASGIARVLADQGHPEEARSLLAAADRHPLTKESATLFGGSAGLALAHLGLYRHTGDQQHVDRALELAAALPSSRELTPLLGPDDATGLLHGRCGIALMLQQLSLVTGDSAHLARGVELLHAELDRAVDPGAAGLEFPVSAVDQRSLPYLFCGSAGMAHTVTRYLRVVDDARLAEALPRLLASLRITYTVMPGLYQGLSGLGLALAEHADLTGEQASRRDATRVARALFKYAVNHPTGVRLLGDQLMRYSTDLWSGSAGLLLFLSHLLEPRPDPLFTVDARTPVAAPARRTPDAPVR